MRARARVFFRVLKNWERWKRRNAFFLCASDAGHLLGTLWTEVKRSRDNRKTVRRDSHRNVTQLT